MPLGLGAPELLIILVIFMVIFGVGRLPEVGKALGEGIRGFREAARTADEVKTELAESSTAEKKAE